MNDEYLFTYLTWDGSYSTLGRDRRDIRILYVYKRLLYVPFLGGSDSGGGMGRGG